MHKKVCISFKTNNCRSYPLKKTHPVAFFVVFGYFFKNIEFPCGSVSEGKSYLETAHAELEEETGYQASLMENIGEFKSIHR